MPAVVVTHAARGLDGVLRGRPGSALRAPGHVPAEDVIVVLDVELVGYLQEGETLVLPRRDLALPTSHLATSPVESYVSVFVPHQVVAVVAVHELFFEQTVRLS